MKYKYSLKHIEDYCNNNNLTDRSNYRSDVCIVVIGHLSYLDTLIKFYKGLKNIVFIVDDSEDASKIDQLKNNGFEVIINEVSKLPNNGFGNVNFQCTSSKIGVQYATVKGYEYVIRMRSDQIILQIDRFINNFDFSKLGFLAYINNTNPHYVEGFHTINNMLSKKYNVDLDTSNLSYNYLMDYCITGPIEKLTTLFNYIEQEKIEAPAEHKMLITYFCENNLKLDNSFQNIKNNFNFILECLRKYEIDFLMLKQDCNNWSVCLVEDAPDLYLYK
jgi:hypothetical protein